MKNILVLLYDYYPNPSANTNCMEPFLKELAKDNNVIIVSSSDEKVSKEYEQINGFDVYRTCDWYRYNKKRIERLKDKGKKFLALVLRAFDKIKRETRDYMDMYWDLDATMDKIIKINEEQKIDMIISESFPFISHYIAKKVVDRFPDIKWFAFTFDPFTTNMLSINKGISKKASIESETLKSAKSIFLFAETYKENIKIKELDGLKDKYHVIDFPLITKKIDLGKTVIKQKNTSDDYITVSFAGRIYEDIRNPEKMLSILYKTMEKYNLNIKLYFYYKMTGNLSSVIDEYKEKFGSKGVFVQDASKEKCDDILATSDIVLNIGNKINNQIPSKIFEVISSGKPIINFYSIEDDTSKPYIEKYCLGMNINSNIVTKDDYDKLKVFIEKNKGNIASFEDATSGLRKTEEVVEDVLKVINAVQ